MKVTNKIFMIELFFLTIGIVLGKISEVSKELYFFVFFISAIAITSILIVWTDSLLEEDLK